MDTPTTLPLDLGKEQFIGVVFDGTGNRLVTCSFPTEQETKSVAMRNYIIAGEAWNQAFIIGDPPMWDLYKRGADAYHRCSRAEATVYGKWSNE